jgi:DNA modification methylase
MAFEIFSGLGYSLRNRIVWTFNFGKNSINRLSGRYETLLWLTKGANYTFNLDKIRVPQRYPGKRYPPNHPRAGQPSGNRAGKNPGDVWIFDGEEAFSEFSLWELPNLKANHPEKTSHPCQFPLELVERCLLAFSVEGDVVLDPFVGSGTTIVAAEKLKRQGIGVERNGTYAATARARLELLRTGKLPQRLNGKEVLKPNVNSRVANVPAEWE